MYVFSEIIRLQDHWAVVLCVLKANPVQNTVPDFADLHVLSKWLKYYKTTQAKDKASILFYHSIS